MIAMTLIFGAAVAFFAVGYFFGLVHGKRIERERQLMRLRVEYDSLADTLDEVTQPAPLRRPMPRWDIN